MKQQTTNLSAQKKVSRYFLFLLPTIFLSVAFLLYSASDVQISTLYFVRNTTNRAGSFWEMLEAGGNETLASYNLQNNSSGLVDRSNSSSIGNTTSYRWRPLHIISIYHIFSDNTMRRKEIDLALRYNIENPAIDKLHLLHGDPLPAIFGNSSIKNLNNATKIVWVKVKKHPSYRELFRYINQNINSTDIAVLTHADIIWRKGTMLNLHRLRQGLIFSLSRHFYEELCPLHSPESRINRNYCRNYVGSHDSFAFIPPLDQSIWKPFWFRPNTYGSENVLIESMKNGKNA